MNKNSKKNDVREKVKEIKLRQQNWLKQRAESKEFSGGDTTPPRPQLSSDSRHAKNVNNSPVSQQKNHVGQNTPKAKENVKSPAQSLIASNKSKAKFQSWLKAKNDHTNQDDVEDASERFNDVNSSAKPYRSDKYSDNYYTDGSYRDHKGSGDVNILRVPSTRSPEFASPDPSWNSDDETGEITAANLLSPEDFDTRADDIIAKVKGDMGMRNNTFSGKGISPGHQVHTSKNINKLTNEPDTNLELSSHVCPTCDKLMMPPNASPMLLIPCGHTLCNSCGKKTKFCAICGCSVQSSTPNIMLQQIISNYHSKQRSAQRKTGSGLKSRSNNYVEEYHNLETRQEILHEEWTNLSKNVEKMTRKLEKEQQQLSNIERKERSIESEIESLQEQLNELSEHKNQYQRNVYDLEMETKQEKNRLILVQDSLKSVEQQMEKVKFLAEEDS